MGAPRKCDYDELRRVAAANPGLSARALAARFGVSDPTVRRILMSDGERAAHDRRQRLWLVAAQPFCKNPDCLNRTWTAYTVGRTGFCQDCWNDWRQRNRVPQHGTESEYRAGCRCRDCTDAARDARQRRRLRQAQELKSPQSADSPCLPSDAAA